MIRGQVISVERGALPFAGIPIALPLRLKPVAYAPEPRRKTRRLGHLEQGHALEMLGHAVEYLIDSRMFGTEAQAVKDNQEAVQILMRLSRVVFSQYPEAAPSGRGVRRWFQGVVSTMTGR